MSLHRALTDDRMPVPGIDDILASPDASPWLKSAIGTALNRDVVDVLNEIEDLRALWSGWLEAVNAARLVAPTHDQPPPLPRAMAEQLRDPGASAWLKAVLVETIALDPGDVRLDLDLLHAVWSVRFDATISQLTELIGAKPIPAPATAHDNRPG